MQTQQHVTGNHHVLQLTAINEHPLSQEWWTTSEEATRRAERPQANDWFRFLQRPHEYFDYRSAKKRWVMF